ncbi:MAG: AbrB/MazE/SpoVT family DNA-binding domain-containing protein [Azoarcus sp.]|nr:AbrB/MazE/SpoVT family DNA-binding domain-containing protein [Azoarcus sp.]
MRVAKWGNSLAVRLPASLVKELDLREGAEVDIDVKRKALPKNGFDAAIRKLRAEMPLLPADFRFDREEANAR